MHRHVHCPDCNSRNLRPIPGVEDVYACQDCGSFFEDDAFVLETLREQRDHKLERTLSE